MLPRGCKVLAQTTYDAQLAGLGWKVGPHPCGFVVHVSGFSQKIDPLLQQVGGAAADLLYIAYVYA